MLLGTHMPNYLSLKCIAFDRVTIEQMSHSELPQKQKKQPELK